VDRQVFFQPIPCGGEHRAVCHISYSPALRMGIINGRELRVAPRFEFPLWVQTCRSSQSQDRRGAADHPSSVPIDDTHGSVRLIIFDRRRRLKNQ